MNLDSIRLIPDVSSYSSNAILVSDAIAFTRLKTNNRLDQIVSSQINEYITRNGKDRDIPTSLLLSYLAHDDELRKVTFGEIENSLINTHLNIKSCVILIRDNEDSLSANVLIGYPSKVKTDCRVSNWSALTSEDLSDVSVNLSNTYVSIKGTFNIPR